MQVGWRKWNGYSEPMGYCEVQNPSDLSHHDLDMFPILHVPKTFTWTLDRADQIWDCGYYNTNPPGTSKTVAWLGFASGRTFQAGGEAHQYHVQIGLNAPYKLLLSSMTYRKTSLTTWTTAKIVEDATVSPYGNDEPAAGQLRVWTDAH